MIAVEQLKKSFGPNPVLRGVSMSQQKGETIVVIGPKLDDVRRRLALHRIAA